MAADLHRLAATALAKAHVPYSNFRVGAAILTTDGRTYSGCNIENASYPEGWCAETTAIAHMVMDGGGTIAEIAVIGASRDGVSPCGGCRQRIAEFGTPETLVHLCNKKEITASHKLSHLLPEAFYLAGE